MSGTHRSGERREGDEDGLLPGRALPADWPPAAWEPPEWPAPGQPRDDWGPPGYEFDGPRRRPPATLWGAPPVPAPPRAQAPAVSARHGEGREAPLFRQVLATMRARNLITGLVLPISVAIAVGIAMVVVAGANNGAGGIAPSQLPAGFPPARAATADFAAGPGKGGQGAGAPVSRVTVNAIATSGATQVAAGAMSGIPALWSSTDGGSTWTRGTGTSRQPGPAALASVTHGPAGWVAVGGPAAAGTIPGTTAPGTTALAPGHPVVVGSADGRTWAASDGEAAFRGQGLVASGVAAGRAGYAIVGWRQAGSHTTGMAWFSAGLTGWQPALLSPPGGDSQLASVTPVPRGFVGVGSAGSRPAAWVSPDGRAWRQVTLPLPASARTASLRYVAAAGGTVVAVGSAVTGAGEAVAFGMVSADGGSTWSEQAMPAPAREPGPLSVTALAAAGQGYAATGTFGPAGNQDVVIWSQGRGAGGWTAAAPQGYGLSGPGVQAITALAAEGSTLTGAGLTAASDVESPTIWQSPIRG